VVFDAGEETACTTSRWNWSKAKSLQALLDAGQAFPLARVLRIMEQTCSALQFAHERSIVHRDIKPANLMLTADDTVKVTDFGTGKNLAVRHRTADRACNGHAELHIAEQSESRVVTAAAIFSLGVMLYE